MLKKTAPLALAAAIALSALGCAAPEREAEVGGGAGTAENARTETGARNEVAFGWGDQMSAAERDYSESYTRATWVHANLASGDWDQAAEDLGFIDEQLAELRQQYHNNQAAGKAIVALNPIVSELRTQIKNRDQGAVQTASRLVTQFNRTTDQLAGLGWLGGQGGGAGRAGAPGVRNEMNDTRDHGTTPDR